MSLMEQVLDTTLQQASGYFGIQTLFPAIQEFAELNTNIKMVNAQLGETHKISSPLNRSIANLAQSAGLSSSKLLGAASAASKYGKTLSQDLMKSTVMFADATGLSSESMGDFIGKMLSIGAVSEDSYKNMLEGILQVRDTYGLTSEAMDDLLRINIKYALITGKTEEELEGASTKLAEFTSRLKAAGVETSVISELMDKMIDPDKMEDNLLLLTKMGMSIHDLTVGDPLKNLESMTPRLKSIAQEIIAQPNRMIANEMAKMYGYTLEEMREFAQIDTTQKGKEKRKELEKYREEIMTATTSLKDLGSSIFGTVAKFLNSTIMPIFDILGPKTSGVIAAGISIKIAKIVQSFMKAGKATEESSKKAGGILRYSLISGAEDASEILRAGISKSFSSASKSTKSKSGLGIDNVQAENSSSVASKNKNKNPVKTANEMIKEYNSSVSEALSESEKAENSSSVASKNKNKNKNPVKTANEMIKEYNSSVSEALSESEKRVQEYDGVLNKFKEAPKKTRDYYKQNLDLIKELNKEDLNWFEKKALEQKEKKFNKPIKWKKKDSLEEQYNITKERTAELYEKYLERDTNLQKLKLNIDELNDLKKSGNITFAQEKELGRMEAYINSVKGSNDNLFKEIKKTKSGMSLLSSIHKSGSETINSLVVKKEELEKNLVAAQAKMNKLVENGNKDKLEELKNTIENLEQGKQHVEDLIKQVNTSMSKAKVEGIEAYTENFVELKQRSKEDFDALEKALNNQIKIDGKKARRDALGLEETASTGRVGLAYAGTAAKAGVGALGSAAKEMLGLGSVADMLNPASLGMMGGTMLVGALMKNEDFQKTVTRLTGNITGLIGNISKAVSPIVDVLAKLIGGPLKLINWGLEKLLALPIFKQKDKEEEENKQNIVDDLRKYEEANRVVYNGKNIEVYFEKLIQTQEEANKIAKGTNQNTEFLALKTNG